MDFVVPLDHWVKLKESEKKDKYLDLAKELKKLWNVKVTFIPIVIGALVTVTKGLRKGLENLEIRGQKETIQTTVIFWPSTRPKNTIPRWCTGRKWHIPMASNRKRSRGRIKAYNMGQGEGPTVPLQWCTGREWPVNCMTVISAWWWLNIRFQRSSGQSCGHWITI